MHVIGQTAVNGGWGTWSSLGYGPGPLLQLTVADDVHGNATVFALGQDHEVYWTTDLGAYQFAGVGGWIRMGGDMQSIAAGLGATGLLEVVAVGVDANVYTNHQLNAGGGGLEALENPPEWGQWSGSIGVALRLSTPVMGHDASGLDVFATVYFQQWLYTRL